MLYRYDSCISTKRTRNSMDMIRPSKIQYSSEITAKNSVDFTVLILILFYVSMFISILGLLLFSSEYHIISFTVDPQLSGPLVYPNLSCVSCVPK